MRKRTALPAPEMWRAHFVPQAMSGGLTPGFSQWGRICAACHQRKQLEHFYSNATTGKFESYCKPCCSVRNKARREREKARHGHQD